MQTHDLTAHPDHPPLAVESIAAKIWRDGPHWLRVRWRVEGTGAMVLPPFAGRHRADNLWQTTCFELFLADDEAYCELNLSPSNAWAAYDFDRYREGMSQRPMSRNPVGAWRGGRSGSAIFDVAISGADLPAAGALGISAVIVEQGGMKSFWALRHPAGKPDFHHPDCFAAQLPPPEQA